VEADTPIELSGLSALKETAHEEVLADAVRSSKDLSQHEASAIHTGMLLERNSWEFYHRAAERATQPDEASLYTQLEEWEKVHLHVLEKAYDLLKERIWAENRFARSSPAQVGCLLLSRSGVLRERRVHHRIDSSQREW